MMKYELRLLPGAGQITAAHRSAGQQMDNLCGPYWGAILLRSRGIDVSAAQLAVQAGSVLPIGTRSWTPPGVSPRQDYQVSLPLTDNLALAGTTVAGLMTAVAKASDGRFALVPLQAKWSLEWVDKFLKLCIANPAWEAVPVCNIRTGLLWGSRLGLGEAIAYLEGKAIQPPPADWDVGHFLTLVGKVEGAANSLILVRDTYPSFGWDGYHLQPAAAIAAALNRDDGLEGGVLLFVAAKDKLEVERQAEAWGFQVTAWDNSTPAKS